MAPKKHLPFTAESDSAGSPSKPHSGLWLDVSPSLGPPQAGAAPGPDGNQGLWLAPGQTQTLQAQGSRRYRLGLRAKHAPTEPLTPTEQPVLVLRHGDDLWLSNAPSAGLVLSGFFATPENQLEIDLGAQAWHLDGLDPGQPISGTDAHLLYWHGQAAHWPEVFDVTTTEGGFALHKTQWQSALTPAQLGEAATTSATSSAATLTANEAGSAASAASGQAAGSAAAASGVAAPTAAGAAAASAAGTSTAAALAATTAAGVGISGAAVGAFALGVGVVAAASSGKKEETSATTTPVTNKAPTALALTTALTNNAIAENTSTTTMTAHATDSGILGDSITSSTQPMLVGQATAGTTVEIWDTFNSVTSKLATVTADSSGSWSANLLAQAAGVHSLVAKQLNADLSVASTSAATALTIDTTAPSAPSAPVLAAGSDTGTSSGDNITSKNTPTLSGTADANAWVSLYQAGSLIGKAKALANGSWSFAVTKAIADGTQALTVKQEDAAGNLSAASSALNVTIAQPQSD